jgi:hypothetical protein
MAAHGSWSKEGLEERTVARDVLRMQLVIHKSREKGHPKELS